MTGVFVAEGDLETETHGREDHVKMEAEIGVMQPQAKECLESPEAGRGKEECSPRAFRRSMVLLTP